MGIGAQELIIILIVLLLLFGTPVLTFVLGYALGRKQQPEAPAAHAEKPQTESSEETQDE